MFVNSIDLQVTSTLDFVLLKSDVTSTTPTEVPGVLPVIVIFCLREYSQYCYTTFVGVLPMSTPSDCFLTVREWSHKY